MIEHEVISFKRKLSEKRTQGLVVDIDETLSWTVGYWMEQMQQRFGNPETLSVDEMVKKYRYTQNVPYWNMEGAKAWIEEARHSDELQDQLPLIQDASHILQKIDKIVPIVGYLTTRPKVVIPGTKRWLNSNNFPQVDILARPADVHHLDGNKWKAEILHYLYPEVIGIIDDNPGLLEHLPKGYKGTIYLFDNEEVMNGTNLRAIPCKTWNDVYTQVKIIHSATPNP